MSVLLLTNPFAVHGTATAGQKVVQGTDASVTATSPAVRIAPATRPADTPRQGSSTSHSGTGAGAGGEAAQRPALSRRPTDATAGSIMAAQIENLMPTLAEISSTMPDPLPTSPFLKGAGQA
ncbi:hypothetical protein FIU94_07930 [Sulfitobacter sp. THAF37]|uniref:hypothetical protein n=1 Tax=Sulfitobacter sp. THAF37 TaxID=2587855 RepID=UPI0012692986|nr:hypothetical protein [Sulfitobacter sp. THAF37]QFT58751.1 hypothetical protein FIU94_07930 [Sulfitobacter sp. THAF37]